MKIFVSVLVSMILVFTFICILVHIIGNLPEYEYYNCKSDEKITEAVKVCCGHNVYPREYDDCMEITRKYMCERRIITKTNSERLLKEEIHKRDEIINLYEKLVEQLEGGKR